MAASGISVTGLQVRVDPVALVKGQPVLRVDHAVVRISAEALKVAAPADVPLGVEHIGGGRIYVRTRLTSVGGMAEVQPSATSQGRLRLDIVGFRAAGFLPIPVSAVLWAVRNFMPPQSGIRFAAGGQLEIDLVELSAALPVTLPPLRKAAVEDTELVLEL